MRGPKQDQGRPFKTYPVKKGEGSLIIGVKAKAAGYQGKNGMYKARENQQPASNHSTGASLLGSRGARGLGDHVPGRAPARTLVCTAALGAELFSLGVWNKVLDNTVHALM